MIAETFLAINGYDVAADEADMLSIWLKLAEDALNEDQLAAWLRRHAIKLDD